MGNFQNEPLQEENFYFDFLAGKIKWNFKRNKINTVVEQ